MLNQQLANWNDFGPTAPFYAVRPPYSKRIFDYCAYTANAVPGRTLAADIGAGTGNFTRLLDGYGLSGFAVEPDRAMLEEGRRAPISERFQWIHGSAEHTGLPTAHIDWVCVSTSFHLMDPAAALTEFNRILKAQGHLTLIWKLREIDKDPLQARIEAFIDEKAPEAIRLYRKARETVASLERAVAATRLFADPIHFDAAHTERLDRASYLAYWRSLEDVPAQVSTAQWTEILSGIDALVPLDDEIAMEHRTHAWTFRKA